MVYDSNLRQLLHLNANGSRLFEGLQQDCSSRAEWDGFRFLQLQEVPRGTLRLMGAINRRKLLRLTDTGPSGFKILKGCRSGINQEGRL